MSLDLSITTRYSSTDSWMAINAPDKTEAVDVSRIFFQNVWTAEHDKKSFLDELKIKLASLQNSARHETLELPLDLLLEREIFSLLGFEELPFSIRQSAFWLTGYLAKKNQIQHLELLEKSLESALQSKDLQIQQSAKRLIKILILCDVDISEKNLDLIDDQGLKSIVDFILNRQVFSSERTKSKVKKLLFKKIKNPSCKDFKEEIATALTYLVQERAEARLLIDYLEDALSKRDQYSLAIEGLSNLSGFQEIFSLSDKAIEWMCYRMKTNSDPETHLDAIRLIAQSMEKQNDTISSNLFRVINLLIQEDDENIVLACLGLILIHLKNSDESKSLPPFLVKILKGLSTRLEFQKEVIEIEKILGIYEEREAHSVPEYFSGIKEKSLFDDVENVEKSLSDLLFEFQDLNLNNKEMIELISSGWFQKTFELIAAITQKLNLEKWEEQDFLDWATLVKSEKKVFEETFIPELIAVMKQAVFLDCGHTLRDAQILSLSAILSASSKGRLAQIATGEGKSKIVAVLAAIKALQSEKVDIITSSPILAKRDANEHADFYGLFGLKVACNNEDKKYQEGPKDLYLADIVYGALSDFQFDLLRDEYELKNTRASRPFATVIVDEVDSMLVDECGQTARLAFEVPAMEQLEPVLVLIWDEFLRLNQHIHLHQDQYLYQPSRDEEPVVIENRFEFTFEILHDFSIQLMQSRGLIIPLHLQDFVHGQLDQWCKSAISAGLFYELDEDYVLMYDENNEKIIAPVDYQNTGVIHPNTSWDNGLHQFLQLKHGLKITPEQLMTCFISNIGYIDRYGKNIFGLSGTIGGNETQELLQDLYPIDIVFIPTFKPKRFVEHPAVLVESHEKWLEALFQSIYKQIESNRAALVLFETILEAEEVSLNLKTQKPLKIKPYFKNESIEKAAISDLLSCQEVILATNLAGRGTDIKTSLNLENHDGLHVTISFLPDNDRIEQQAFGRTSRQGKKGTGQLIINKQEAQKKLLAKYPSLGSADSIENLKKWRDTVESIRLHDIKHHHLERIRLQDLLFSKFQILIRELRKINQDPFKLKTIEEKWGFWLKITENKINKATKLDVKSILAEFEEFSKKLRDDFTKLAISNPLQFIDLGNFLRDETTLKIQGKTFQATWSNGTAAFLEGDRPKLYQAIEAYNQAIKLDPTFSVQSFYNRALAKLLLQTGNYLKEALHDLTQAKDIIEEQLIPQLQMMQLIYSSTNHAQLQEGHLNNQINFKINLFRLQISHIDGTLASIQRVLTHPEGGRVTVARETPLSDFFDDPDQYRQEIREFRNLGLHRLYQVEHQLFDEDIDALGMFGSAILGGMQTLLGICSTMAGHPYLGALLIEEGISDFVYTAECVLGLESFSWKSYKTNKIASTAWNATMLGMNVIKSHISKNPLQKALHTPLKTACERKAIKKIIQDKVISSLITSSARAVINFGLSHLSKDLVGKIRPQIAKEVQAVLLEYFQRPETITTLNTLCSIDPYMQQKLMEIAYELIHPKTNQLSRIGQGVFKGLIASQHRALASLIHIADIAGVIEKITNLADRFCEDFNHKLQYVLHQLPNSNPALAQDVPRAREELLHKITNMVTSCIMSSIHGGITKPTVNSFVSSNLDNLSKKISFQKAVEASREINNKEHEKRRPPIFDATSSSHALRVNRRDSRSIQDIYPIQLGMSASADAVEDESNLGFFEKWQVSNRAFGALQCIMGASQVGLGLAGGLITIETGLGPYVGGSLAMMGIDNAAAGCQTAWTGVPTNTLMNQGLQGLGLSETGANISEFALGLSPFAAPKLKQAVMYNKELASFAAQEVRTFLVLRNGSLFRSPTVYNSRSSRGVAESVYKKIDTAKFNPEARFGPAFYAAKKIGTTISELRFHKVNPTHSIQFQLNDKKAIVLDLTQPSIARKWGYIGENDYTSAKLIAQKAHDLGYNMILYRSEREIGEVNVAIIKDFDKLLKPKKIVQIPLKYSK